MLLGKEGEISLAVNLSQIFLTFGKNDFIDDKEYHHRNTAVENGGDDIVKPTLHKMAGHGNPNAIDRVDYASDQAKGQEIPHSLIGHIALTTEYIFSLDKEIDHLANHHGQHIGSKIGNAPLLCAVSDNVPFKGNAKQGHGCTGKAEISAAHKGKGGR